MDVWGAPYMGRMKGAKERKKRREMQKDVDKETQRHM